MSRGDAEGQARDGDAIFQPASTEDTLREGPRQFFALAAEVARGQFDPSVQWREFVQALWDQIDAGFRLAVDDGDSEAPLAWFEEAGDAEVVVWGPRSAGR